MRFLALAFVVFSFSALACDSLPAELKVKKLTGDFKTLTGDYRLEVSFVDLETTSCEIGQDRVARIKDAVTVKVLELNGNRVVQSFTSDLSTLLDTIYIVKPHQMTGAGLEIGLNKDKKVVIRLNGAAIFPTVTL